MRKLFIAIAFGIGLTSCGSGYTNDLEYDVDMEIVAINSSNDLTDDKFHTPETCNRILLKTTTGDIRYVELNTCKLGCGINITTEWLYNHRVGDKVHFDYLLKERFFRIYR